MRLSTNKVPQRKLEHRQIGLSTYRMAPRAWMWKAADLSQGGCVVTIGHKEGGLVHPRDIDVHSWVFVEDNQLELDLPSDFFDVVFVNEVLETYDRSHQKKFLAVLGDLLKEGGRVVSCSKACNDSQELHDLLSPIGVDLNKFEKERLNNKDITRLRPSVAAFLEDVDHVPDRKRLVTYCKDRNIEGVSLEHLFHAGTRFSINRLHVGMLWTRT